MIKFVPISKIHLQFIFLLVGTSIILFSLQVLLINDTNHFNVNSIFTSDSFRRILVTSDSLDSLIHYGTKWYYLPSSWSETAILFRPIVAFFDKSTLSNETDELYIKVYMVTQRDHFNGQYYIFEKNIQSSFCQVFYKSNSSDISISSSIKKVIVAQKSNFEQAGTISAFSTPYYAYCAIDKNQTSLPIAVKFFIDPTIQGEPYIIENSKPKKTQPFWIEGRNVSESIAIQGGSDFSIDSTGNITIPKNKIKDIMICVSPHVGEGMISEDYDDPHIFISFLTYYAALGVRSFLFYNSGAGKLSQIWLYEIAEAAKLSHIDIEMVPDQQYNLDSVNAENSESSDPHIFPLTLFPDVCLRKAKYTSKYVILLDYFDFIFPKHFAANITQFVAHLEEKYPQAASFKLQNLVIPGPIPYRRCNNEYLDSHLQSIACKSPHHAPHIQAHIPRSTNGYRNIIKTSEISSCNHSSVFTNETQNRNTVEISLSLEIGFIASYRPSNYVAGGIIDPSPNSLHQSLWKNITLQKSLKKIFHSKLYTEIERRIPYRSFSTSLNSIHKGNNQHNRASLDNLPIKWNTSYNALKINYMHLGHIKIVPRLLIFTTINPVKEMANIVEWRRKILAVSSWVKLALETPVSTAIVRVMVVVSSLSHCDIMLPHIYPRGDTLNKNNYNDKTAAGTAGQQRKSPLLCLLAPSCAHPWYSIPTIDCIFKFAVNTAHPSEYIMYSNSDMIYFSDLISTFTMAYQSKNTFPGQEFALLGKRLNLDTNELDYNLKDKSTPFTKEEMQIKNRTHWDSDDFILSKLAEFEFKVRRKISGGSDSNYCQDYFIMSPKNFPTKLHPFLVGRALWDNSISSFLHTEGNYTQDGKLIIRYTYIEVTNTVLALHTFFKGHLDYNFDKRVGHIWNDRLVDYHDRLWRTQMGQTLLAEVESRGNCSANCTFDWRGSNPTWWPQR